MTLGHLCAFAGMQRVPQDALRAALPRFREGEAGEDGKVGLFRVPHHAREGGHS